MKTQRIFPESPPLDCRAKSCMNVTLVLLVMWISLTSSAWAGFLFSEEGQNGDIEKLTNVSSLAEVYSTEDIWLRVSGQSNAYVESIHNFTDDVFYNEQIGGKTLGLNRGGIGVYYNTGIEAGDYAGRELIMSVRAGRRWPALSRVGFEVLLWSNEGDIKTLMSGTFLPTYQGYFERSPEIRYTVQPEDTGVFIAHLFNTGDEYRIYADGVQFVPEPATLLLLGSGVMFLARKKKDTSI